ncbi:protein kinase [Angomonas deanei]|nr:protein kinase [Angomonas deanei]|eukprot:EPY36579.1 protein kinase [Angomonas deanei]
MGNDRVKNLAFESQEMGGGLAQFHNQPQECAGCGTAGVAYTCDTCESYFLCEDCRFTDAIIGQHDTSHTIVPIQEGHCNSSRTFGGDSYSMTADGGNSYLFYNPCSTCKKVIDDTEVVYRCEQCNFLVCENCYGDPNSEHEHDLHRFQRRTRNSSVQETVLKNKSRSSDGNRIINDYVVVGVLGKGSYAKVKLVQHINTRELYALKIIKRKRSNRSSTSNSLKKSSVKSTEMNQDDLLREIAVMKFIDHPNVVQLKEVIEDTDLSRVYVIMEYCEKGPVHVLGNPPLSLETTRNYGCDILKGILHLHHEYLYHRDIKPANCLVDSLDTAKLADFGTCSSIVKQDTQQTPAFQCPETVRGDGDNVTGNVVDSWSFALTVYQMAFGSLPFDISSFGKLRQQIIGPEKVFIPEDCDPTLKDVLTRMLEKDIEKRMLVAEAASHPFFGLDQDGNECSRRMSTSNVDMKPKVNEELYTRAAQEIRHGKNLNDCFHGIRAIRRMRRKEVNKANYSGAPTGAEEEDDDWLNELDSLNNSNSNFPNRNDAASSTANGEYGMSELVEQASVALSVSKSTRARGASAQGASTEKVKEVIQNLVQNNDKDTVLRLIKIPFATPPPQITEVSSFATELRMAHNGLLKAGPIDYSVFKMLKDITINGNKLTAFPEEVLMAPRLLRLDLSSNRITSIPPTIRQARFLQRLNLQNNLITDVGVDNNGNSVLAGPSLRHVRLSTNPVKHIPKALETTTNLSLVLDTIPALMAEWNKVVQENKSKPPAVVIWDDYFPEVIKDTKPPVWIASNYLSLYRAHTLETCNVQHVVLLQNSDKRFPKGLFSSHDLTVYFAKLASRVGDIVHDKENSNPSSPTAGDHNDMVRSAVASALCTLPPVVNRFARRRIHVLLRL